MNAIHQQTARVRSRLFLQRFGTWFSWSLFIGLFSAVVGILVPKVWPMEAASPNWVWGWLGGSAAIATLAAVIGTWWGAPTRERAAQELDRRFGLKERVSSALAMGVLDRESPAGRALIADAEKRVGQIEIQDQFPLQAHARGLLPVLPAALVAILVMVPDAHSKPATSLNKKTEVTQVKTASEQLKKQLEQRRRTAEAKGLEETQELYKQIESGIDKLQAQSAADRKDALVKLNELKDTLEKRRDELGSAEQTKQNLKNLKNLEQGPADKVAKNMEKGNFGQAAEELKTLAKKMKDGELSKEQQKQLQKQVEQLQKQLGEMTAKHEQAKEQLEKQIEQAKREGDLNQASKLQEKLNQLRQQDQAMQQLQKMANAMGQAAEQMEKGDTPGAAQQLEQMANQLGEMQGDIDQLQDLESALDQFDQAKEAMRCQGCSGEGCAQCQGNSDRFSRGDWGKGKGRGEGWRDLEEDQTNNYESQVRAKPGAGKSVASGFATGPNRKGVTQADVSQAVEAGIIDKSDPIEDLPLPRTERDHTRAYFDQLREGNPSAATP